MSSIRRIDARDRRTYDIPGVGELVSVTTYLKAIPKPELVGWAARRERELVVDAAVRLGTVTRATLLNQLPALHAHEIELDVAGELGSEAHALIEWWLRGEIGPRPPARPGAEMAFRAAQKWAASVQLEPIFCEQTVWSEEWGFAGTMDLFGRVNGKLALIDWKTSKRFYPEHGLQSAAYITALDEMGHAKSDEVLGVIVRLPKETDGPAEAHILEPSHAERFRRFALAMETWRWMREVEGAYVPKAALPIDRPEQIASNNAFSFTERT